MSAASSSVNCVDFEVTSALSVKSIGATKLSIGSGSKKTSFMKQPSGPKNHGTEERRSTPAQHNIENDLLRKSKMEQAPA